MMTVSVPGAVLLVFVDEATLKQTIDNLQNLLKEHQDGKLPYPGIYGVSKVEPVDGKQLATICSVAARMVGSSGFMPPKPPKLEVAPASPKQP